MRRQIVNCMLAGLMALAGAACLPGPAPRPPAGPVTLVVQVHDFVMPTRPVVAAVSCDADGAAGRADADGHVSLTFLSRAVLRCELAAEGYLGKVDTYSGLTSQVISTWMEAVAAAVPTTPATPLPTVPVVSAHATRGRLRVTARGFADAEGPRLPLYAHAGNLFSLFMRDEARALAELNDVALAGYQGVRTWSTLGGSYWAGDHVGPDITPDFWAGLRRFALALRARGLRAVWSQGDVGQLRDRRAYMTRLAELDTEIPFIDVIDCGNESWQTGEPDPAKLAQCVGYYQSAGGHAVRTLSSPPGEVAAELDAFSVAPAQIWDVHSWRDGHLYDMVRHVFSIGYEQPTRLRYGINSEPPGNGDLVSVTANKHEIDDEGAAVLAATGALANQAWVWFSGEGVKVRDGLATQAGFLSVPRTIAMLPSDLQSWPDLFHSGESQRARRILEAVGEVRVDCRAAGRFVCVIYGPAGVYRLPVARAFAGRLCDPGMGVCEDVSHRAGDRLPVTFRRGRVLIGALQ